MPSNRKKMLPLTATKVLLRSKRRCCLCVGLENDLGVKEVQIAHIDRNKDNHTYDNLVCLCLPHHDKYDEIRRQTKQLSQAELKHYRSVLDKIIQKKDEQLSLSIKNASNEKENQIATPSAKLLGQIVEAYDRESFALQNNNQANGIALARLAQIAVEEEGDFDTAMEAFISLLRLSTLERSRRLKGNISKLHDSDYSSLFYVGRISANDSVIPRASLRNSASKVLDIMAQTDFGLFHKALNQSSKYALVGEEGFEMFSDYDSLPYISFGATNSVLVASCCIFASKKNLEAERFVANALMYALVSVGFVLSERGISLPLPPTRMLASYNGRWIEADQDRNLFPVISLAHAIAHLPDSSFEFAVKTIEYGFMLVPVINSNANSAFKSYTLQEGLLSLKRQAAFQGANTIYIINMQTKEGEKKINEEIERIRERGNKVIIDLLNFLIGERSLVLNYRKIK